MLTLSVFIVGAQAAERDVHRYGGHVNHPVPERRFWFCAATRVGDQDKRAGTNTGVL